jgi:hypothetical protein
MLGKIQREFRAPSGPAAFIDVLAALNPPMERIGFECCSLTSLAVSRDGPSRASGAVYRNSRR